MIELTNKQQKSLKKDIKRQYGLEWEEVYDDVLESDDSDVQTHGDVAVYVYEVETVSIVEGVKTIIGHDALVTITDSGVIVRKHIR